MEHALNSTTAIMILIETAEVWLEFQLAKLEIGLKLGAEGHPVFTESLTLHEIVVVMYIVQGCTLIPL